MIAESLISTRIPPLKPSDTIRFSLDRMAEFKVYHLPIISELKYAGLVSEEELAEQKDVNQSISTLSLRLINAFSYHHTHIYQVIRLFSDMQLSLVPIVDQQQYYLGAVTIHKILSYTADIFACKEPGAIIVLSLSNRNNSLAQMAQIVEIENAQILSSYVQSFPDSTRLEVTLKLNKTDVSAILASFQRYDYEIKAVFNNQGTDSGYIDRYNSFMNYLNV